MSIIHDGEEQEQPNKDNYDFEYWFDAAHPLTCGARGTFTCPRCYSNNTLEGVYFKECQDCDWGQGK